MSNMKRIYITCIFLYMASTVSAQSYDIVERRNPWNAGANVTGIMVDSTPFPMLNYMAGIIMAISTIITKLISYGTQVQ